MDTPIASSIQPRDPCPPIFGCLACQTLTGPGGPSAKDRRIHPVHIYRGWDFILSIREVLHHQTPWRVVEPFLRSRGYYLDQMALTDVEPILGTAVTLKSPLVRPAIDRQGFEVFIKSLAVNVPRRAELTVWHRLTTPSALRDPRNHTAPVHEFIPFTPSFPGHAYVPTDAREFLVTPRLAALRRDAVYCSQEFLTPDVQTSLDLFFQVLEGMEYMHLCGIAHGDIGSHNMVLSRTPEGKPRYHFIDFEMSSIHTLAEPPEHVAAQLINNVGPEYSLVRPFNPFPNDIFAAGQWFRRYLTADEPEKGIHPSWSQVTNIEELTNAMLSTDPRDRPTATEARRVIKRLLRTLPENVLRLPIARRTPMQQWNSPPTLDEALGSLSTQNQSPSMQYSPTFAAHAASASPPAQYPSPLSAYPSPPDIHYGGGPQSYPSPPSTQSSPPSVQYSASPPMYPNTPATYAST